MERKILNTVMNQGKFIKMNMGIKNKIMTIFWKDVLYGKHYCIYTSELHKINFISIMFKNCYYSVSLSQSLSRKTFINTFISSKSTND